MKDKGRNFDELLKSSGQGMVESTSLTKEKHLLRLANDWIDALLSIECSDLGVIDDAKNILMKLGKKEQAEFWQLSNALKQPLQRLMNDTHSTDRVNDLLQNMQHKILKLKPPKKNNGGLKAMFLLLFSWKQSAWQLWLENYHELKKEVQTSSKELAAEKAQLERENQILSDEKAELKNQLMKLEHVFDLLVMLTEKINEQFNNHSSSKEEIVSLFEHEFIPILHERISDLQQQLLIGRQTLMTIDLINNQNLTQVNGIGQALQTTASALDVTAGLVLAKQGRQALDKLEKNRKISPNMSAISTLELEKVQQSIDDALQQIEGTRKAYNESTLDANKA